jgi:hypothetical protein
MLVMVLTPRQLVHQVGGSVKCDSSSTIVGATRLITGASGIALDDGIRFPSEFSVAIGAYALGQVLRFGSLAYITDCHNELRLLQRAVHGITVVAFHPEVFRVSYFYEEWMCKSLLASSPKVTRRKIAQVVRFSKDRDPKLR